VAAADIEPTAISDVTVRFIFDSPGVVLLFMVLRGLLLEVPLELDFAGRDEPPRRTARRSPVVSFFPRAVSRSGRDDASAEVAAKSR
jgi:hypothetical protein